MHRSIVHLDLDSFFVSVERLTNPALVGKPVIVGGGERGVVAACSYEARRFGIHSAMPARTARMLCPEAIFVKGDYDSYSKYSGLITQMITEKAPVVEKASIDEFYLDLTGMDRFFGCYKWAMELRQFIYKETGLTTTLALSTSKVVSKIAVQEVKPDRETQVPAGTEVAYLKPLKVNKMPMIGDKTAQMLYNMGIHTLGQLAEIPLKVLIRVFGQNGTWMWERARGIDYSEVVPYTEQKSMSKESTFNSDTTDVEFLRLQIIAMVNELAFDLRKNNYTTGCIAIKLRYSDFETHTRQIAIPYTNADHTIRRHALELFEKLYSRRILVRLIGVRLTKLAAGGSQLNLFDNSSVISPLYLAMDKVRSKYGLSAVQPASTLHLQKRNAPNLFKK